MYKTASGRYIEKLDKEINGRKYVTATSKKKFLEKYTELMSQAERGPLFSDVADSWAENHFKTISPCTASAYLAHTNRAKEYFNGEHICELTPGDIQAYIQWIAAKGYAKDTVRRALICVSLIFDYAIIQPHSPIRTNPCKAVSIPKNLSKIRRLPPAEEIISKISPNSEMGLFATFMLYTGMRNGELLALEWEDIDFEAKLIHVTKSVEYNGDIPKVKKGAKTDAGVRDIPLLDELSAALQGKQKKGLVFGGKEPIRKREFYRRWGKWCSEIGCGTTECIKHTSKNKTEYYETKYVPDFTPYQLRHKFASMLEESGVSDFYAMTVMGHTSLQMTKGNYTHANDKKLQSCVAEKMNEMISSDKQKNFSESPKS